MKISKANLQRIIAEEYSKLKSDGLLAESRDVGATVLDLASRPAGVDLDTLMKIAGPAAFDAVDRLAEEGIVFLDDQEGVVYASGSRPSAGLSGAVKRYIGESMHSAMDTSYRGRSGTFGMGGMPGPAGIRGGGMENPAIARIHSGINDYMVREDMTPGEVAGLKSALHVLESGMKYGDDPMIVAEKIIEMGLDAALMELEYILFDTDGDTGAVTNFARQVAKHLG
tara:strand:- start:269 stop:946 length:678 start_codon:yes stop_codon:yes gene_type:complete